MKEPEYIDYQVETQVTLEYMHHPEMISTPITRAAQEHFAKSVRDIFAQDATLPMYVQGDLKFNFEGNKVHIGYNFTCADESPEEAESFSKYCVHGVESELKKLNCKVQEISCTVEEMDMSWLDKLEDQIFGPR